MQTVETDVNGTAGFHFDRPTKNIKKKLQKSKEKRQKIGGIQNEMPLFVDCVIVGGAR